MSENERAIYPRTGIDPFSGLERCRAKRSTTRNGTYTRCFNRAKTTAGGLCWRHR